MKTAVRFESRESSATPSTWRSYLRGTTLAFWGVHVAAVVGVIICGWSWAGVALALGSYFVRMFVVTAAYHRYFSHRAFKTSRWFQLLLAVGAQTAAQRGVIWWASHHRCGGRQRRQVPIGRGCRHRRQCGGDAGAGHRRMTGVRRAPAAAPPFKHLTSQPL
jgi:hypothetical protein